jgi:hypothetical protein
MQMRIRDKSVKRTAVTFTDPVSNKSKSLTVYGVTPAQLLKRVRRIAELSEDQLQRVFEPSYTGKGHSATAEG